MVANDHDLQTERSCGPRLTASHDRGQLILIGAITLAFIILGIVVVFNGVLYTETLSSGPSSQGASDVNLAEHEMAGGVSGIAHYGNVEGKWGKSSYNESMGTYINGSGEFADQYRNTTANSRPVVTNVSFNETTEGATVTTGDIQTGTIPEVTNSVGHFELDLNSSSNKSITVNATTTDGTTSEVTINTTSKRFTVEGSSCEIKGDRARFDLVSGEVNLRVKDDCTASEIEQLESSLSIIDPGESYDEIAFGSTDLVDGTFELVWKGYDESLTLNDILGNTHYGGWAVTVDVRYESHDVSYERTRTVEIYGGNG